MLQLLMMNRQLLICSSVAIGATLSFANFASPAAAATISLEIVSERGVQITAPQQWLQLLTRLEVTNVRIRGAQGGEQTSLETLDGKRGAIYRLTGVLNSKGTLHLPGGAFTQRDTAKLRDYFDRLLADGEEGVLAVRGKYGLTKKQFEDLFHNLGRPLAISTSTINVQRLLERIASRLDATVEVDPAARSKLRVSKPIEVELKELSLGVSLAIALRREGLALAPHKPRGKPVTLTIVPVADESRDESQETWPIGYKIDGPPRKAAPDLMQVMNRVEIDGFSLAEATGAIEQRLKVPLIWDTHALAQRQIDPAKVQVKLLAGRLSYKRILEKLLFQARLKGELRTDEAGEPFYWITR